jgi:hypothetical protein
VAFDLWFRQQCWILMDFCEKEVMADVNISRTPRNHRLSATRVYNFITLVKTWNFLECEVSSFWLLSREIYQRCSTRSVRRSPDGSQIDGAGGAMLATDRACILNNRKQIVACKNMKGPVEQQIKHIQWYSSYTGHCIYIWPDKLITNADQ